MVKGFGKLEVKPQQKREAEILRKSVLKHFQHLQDPRVERTKDHSLVAIITIVILAVLSGANGFVAIATYGKAKQAWLGPFYSHSALQFVVLSKYLLSDFRQGKSAPCGEG